MAPVPDTAPPAKPSFRRYAWAAGLLLFLGLMAYGQSVRDRGPAVVDPSGLAALPADAQESGSARRWPPDRCRCRRPSPPSPDDASP